MPKKNIIKKFDYPLELVENLILDIDSYKDFLPWCSDSKIISKKNNDKLIEIEADLEIGYSFVKDTYKSHVIYNKQKRKITVKGIDGPLKSLENVWILKKIKENKCEVEFYINLELKNIILNKMLNRMFDHGFKKILNSFEHRAKFLANLK